MKLSAVICEYNPFHKGHSYQLSTLRNRLDCDGVVGVMSGNFVQRGDVACFPKELRARAALAHGMDLVLELPAVLTLHSAERYARNAVQTIDALGCVDNLVFGAECPDVDLLLGIAKALVQEDGNFIQQLKTNLAEGISFAAARAKAIRQILGPASADILNQPNNILAVEYCKALLQCNSKIRPVAILRKGPDHDAIQATDGFASASAIRQLLIKGEDASPYLPMESLNLFQDQPVFSMASLEKTLIANLSLISLGDLQQIADVSEGLEYALKREVQRASSLDSLIQNVKSKRYAYSRIRRIVLNAYLGIRQKDTLLTPSYIKILDFNQQGQKILNHAKNYATLPLAKNGKQIKDNPDALHLWQRELAIDRVYRLFSSSPVPTQEIEEP